MQIHLTGKQSETIVVECVCPNIMEPYFEVILMLRSYEQLVESLTTGLSEYILDPELASMTRIYRLTSLPFVLINFSFQRIPRKNFMHARPTQFSAISLGPSYSNIMEHIRSGECPCVS